MRIVLVTLWFLLYVRHVLKLSHKPFCSVESCAYCVIYWMSRHCVTAVCESSCFYIVLCKLQIVLSWQYGGWLTWHSAGSSDSITEVDEYLSTAVMPDLLPKYWIVVLVCFDVLKFCQRDVTGSLTYSCSIDCCCFKMTLFRHSIKAIVYCYSTHAFTLYVLRSSSCLCFGRKTMNEVREIIVCQSFVIIFICDCVVHSWLVDWLIDWSFDIHCEMTCEIDSRVLNIFLNVDFRRFISWNFWVKININYVLKIVEITLSAGLIKWL